MSHVRGQAELREIEGRLLRAPVELDKAMVKHLRTVPPKVERLVRADAALKLPKRGGYAAVMEAALRFKSSVGAKRGLTMTVWAQGKRENRDVPRINRGELRHPLWGNRGFWKTTHVPRGFVTKPLERGGELALEAVRDARDDVGHMITK